VALCERIREIAPDADNLLDNIEATWLCAPKAFRYVERIIQAIGGGGDEPVLDEDDTRVDIEGHAVWYGDFMKRLGAWLTGNASACGEMGPVTPVRHWLGWLLHHKLELYERHNPFARLVGR